MSTASFGIADPIVVGGLGDFERQPCRLQSAVRQGGSDVGGEIDSGELTAADVDRDRDRTAMLLPLGTLISDSSPQPSYGEVPVGTRLAPDRMLPVFTLSVVGTGEESGAQA